MVMRIDYDLKKAYFNYICEFLCDTKHHRVDYAPLLDMLYSIPFEAVLDRDSNRIADGEAIRQDFIKDEDIDIEYYCELEDIDVSVLEVLFAIARRLEFQVGNEMGVDNTCEKFWLLLRNLDIEKYSADNFKPVNIREKVRTWMYRKFKRDGNGSIFPLKHPESDQRELEIWDQMSAYIWENWFEE